MIEGNGVVGNRDAIPYLKNDREYNDNESCVSFNGTTEIMMLILLGFLVASNFNVGQTTNELSYNKVKDT